jgi:hypothetical protein
MILLLNLNMLLTKRKLNSLKIFFISPRMERILLISYFIFFSLTIFFSNFESNMTLGNYAVRNNLISYY